MKKIILNLLLALFTVCHSFAQTEEETVDSVALQNMVDYLIQSDSINKTFTYQYGTIELDNGLATIHVPKGYKFLDATQSHRVLEELWGNPPSPLLGLLFPDTIDPMSYDLTYVVEVSYSEEGFIKDDDAKDIDYDELLEQMKEDVVEANKQRKEEGYPEVKLIGWASEPFYDENNKKLHWAKELSFEGSTDNTLNYNIRILGRNGFINLNVIGDMDVLPMVKENIDLILASVTFNEGKTYFDFDPDIDDVAAYGIGGLIAGKLLAKAGFFVLFLKFWKIIALAVVAGFAGLRSWFTRVITGRNPKNEKEKLSNKNLE